MNKQSYLSENGKRIFDLIMSHCEKMNIADQIDTFELSMLANEFDKYAMAAELASGKGISGYINSFGNGTVQVNAYHTIMKDCYGVILKHSAKFGLNPGDRKRIFDVKKLDGKSKKKGFDTDNKMKVA